MMGSDLVDNHSAIPVAKYLLNISKIPLVQRPLGSLVGAFLPIKKRRNSLGTRLARVCPVFGLASLITAGYMHGFVWAWICNDFVFVSLEIRNYHFHKHTSSTSLR